MFAADTHEPGFISVDITTKPGLENWRGATNIGSDLSQLAKVASQLIQTALTPGQDGLPSPDEIESMVRCGGWERRHAATFAVSPAAFAKSKVKHQAKVDPAVAAHRKR